MHRKQRQAWYSRGGDALAAGGGKIAYEYDFGAGWTHEVTLQSKLPRDPAGVYPVCTKFSGDSPVEYPEEDIWYSGGIGKSDPAEPCPAEPESFDLVGLGRALDGCDSAARTPLDFGE